MLCVALLLLPAFASANTVLAVFADTEASPASGPLLRGLRAGLGDRTVRAAYLALPDSADEEDARAAMKRVRSELEGVAVSAVVAVGPSAASFVAMFRDTPPFDVPLVAVNVPQGLRDCPSTHSGNGEEALFSMVLEQHPDIRTLIVFTADDESGARQRSVMERIAARHPAPPLLIFPGFEVGRTGPLDTKSVLTLVRAAPKRSAVIVMGYPVPGSAPGLTQRVAEASAAPVYAGGDVPPVSGLEGAATTDWQAHGLAAAGLITDKVVDDLVMTIPPRIQFDLHAEQSPAPLSGHDKPGTQARHSGTILLAALAAGALFVAVLCVILLRRR